MSMFYKILDEQKQLMNVKGFDEKSLNAAEREGYFMRQLQSAFSFSSNEAHRFNESSAFDLIAVGFFNDNKDIVVFMFNYEYDPDIMELRIKKLSADFEGKKLSFPLNQNKDLPSSAEVYQQFTLEKANKITVNENASADNVKRLDNAHYISQHTPQKSIGRKL